MTREEIEAMFARRYEYWNRRDTAALVKDLSEDSIVESPFAGHVARGPAAIEEVHRSFFRTFPDARLTWDNTLIDGDHVTLIGRLAGTDQGGFMGLMPTGRSFDIPIVTVNELHNGQIVRQRYIYDFAGMLVQVGALKAKPI